MNIPWSLCHQCPCPQSGQHLIPASLKDPQALRDPTSRCAGRPGPGFYEVAALPWVPVQRKPDVHPPRMESLFLPVLCICTLRSIGLQSQIFWGFSSRCQTLRLRIPMWNLELSLMWENPCDILFFFFSLGVAHQVCMEFDYIMRVPLLPSHCGVLFFFGCRISFLQFPISFLMVVQQVFLILMFL